MGKLIQLKTDQGAILIESTMSEQTGRIEAAGGIENKLGKKLSDMLQVIQPIAEGVLQARNNLAAKPDKVETEFGLSVTAEGNIFVVKATGEATLKVTFTWGK